MTRLLNPFQGLDFNMNAAKAALTQTLRQALPDNPVWSMDDDDAGADTSTTATITPNGSVTGNIETGGDKDWFRFSAVEGQSYNTGLVGTGFSDTYLELFNSSGTLVTFNDDLGSSLSSGFTFTAIATGDMFLAASALEDNDTGGYTLTLNTQDFPEIRGTEAADSLSGTQLDDTILGFGGNDFLGDDGGTNILDGGAGNDNLEVLSGANTLIGGQGDDLLQGQDSASDTAVYSGNRSDYLIMRTEFNNGYRIEDLRGLDGTDDLFGIEFVSFGGTADNPVTLDDSLIRTRANNDEAGNPFFYSGTGGRDLISGDDDNESLYGQGGSDYVNGGGGNDTLVGDNATALGDIEGQLFRAYRAVFDRDPDLAGLQAFRTEILLGNLTQTDVIAEFVSSLEFQNSYGALGNGDFVDLLYQNVFDRAADAEGRAANIAALDGGTSRADIVIGFANSQEFITKTLVDGSGFATNVVIDPIQAQVFRLYQAIFDRAPDAGGFRIFVSDMQNNIQSFDQVVDFFIQSDEYVQTYGALDNTAFVEALYTNVLPGNMDAQGRANFISALDSEALTRTAVVVQFVESAEFRARTNDDATSFVRGLDIDADDLLIGGQGDDILAGLEGDDSFIFDVLNSGNDRIVDFIAGDQSGDMIIFQGDAGLDSFAAIMTNAAQVGADTVFTFNGEFGTQNTLTLSNVVMDTLTAGDFQLPNNMSAQIAIPYDPGEDDYSHFFAGLDDDGHLDAA